MARFKFEQHACLNIRRSGLNGPPEQPSPKDPERRTTSPGFMRASYPKHLKAACLRAKQHPHARAEFSTGLHLRTQRLIPQTEGMSHKKETDQDMDDALNATFN